MQRPAAGVVDEAPQHLVEFYETDAYLAGAIADFAAEGLAAGAPVAIIATEPHRVAALRRLRERGFDDATHGIVFLDAGEVLAEVMRGSMPDRERFVAVVGSALEELARASDTGRVRAYGEMVDLLWQRGNAPAAISLEAMWSDLQRLQGFSLLCAYAIAAFGEDASALRRVCEQHTHVRAVEVGRAPSGVQVLIEEVDRRIQVEGALRTSLRELCAREGELVDFVENATVGLHWVGPDGTILWANRADYEFLGFEAGEYIGRSIVDFHADEDAAADILARLTRNETLRNYEARLRAKDGSIRHVLLSSNVYWRDGEFVHTRCFTRDITELRRLVEAREASQRRREQLVRIATAIADAVSEQDVYEAVVDEVGAALGASSAALWLVSDDRRRAELVRSYGDHQPIDRAAESAALDGASRFPALDAIRSGEAIWLASADEWAEGHPHLAHVCAGPDSYRVSCLPLAVEGRTLGCLVISFHAPPIDDEEKAFLLLAARYSGQALERLRLVESERQRRLRTELLSNASRAFTEASLNRTEVLNAIAEHVTRQLADACMIVLVPEHGDGLGVEAVQHRDRAAAEELRSLIDREPPKVGEGVTGRVVASGEPEFLPIVDRDDLVAQLAPSHRAWAEAHCPRSVISVPLRARSRVLGALTAARQAWTPPFQVEDVRLLEEIAERAALAIEHADLHEREQRARTRAESLYGLAHAVIAADRVERIFEAALDAIERALGASRVAVHVIAADGAARVQSSRGLSEAYERAVQDSPSWPRESRARESVVIADVAAAPAWTSLVPALRREGVAALVSVPLVVSDASIGELVVYFPEPKALDAGELDLVRAVADHVVTGIARFDAVAELEQSVRSTGVLGHDLRNPLSAMVTAAQFALMSSESAAIRSPLTRIVRSGERMARMILQLLDFTRVRVGAGIPLAPRPMSLVPVVRHVMDELDDAHPEWTLTLEHEGDATGTWDADRLAQVFSNLVGNAVQYGQVGHGVSVRIDGKAAEMVRVEIHNMGAIAASLLPTLFEPLAHEKRRGGRSRGLGLGLYICREIAKAHGGRVEVSSREDRGTTFTVWLPRSAG